jgi:hypothetical protein
MASRIRAIKDFREWQGTSLREAKDLVESLIQERETARGKAIVQANYDACMRFRTADSNLNKWSEEYNDASRALREAGVKTLDFQLIRDY